MLQLVESATCQSDDRNFDLGLQQSEVSCWYALYTKSRHEKVVDRELHKKALESFLPLRRIKRHWSDRVKLIDEPLLQGYVFVRIPLSKKLWVLNTAGVVALVSFGSGQPARIADREIEALRRFEVEKISVDPFPYLNSGQRVCIRSGPMSGVEGFIVRKDNRCRLVISLDVLMQSISVEVDAACVQVV